MTPPRLLLSSLLALLVFSGSGQAQQTGSNPKAEPWNSVAAELDAIHECVREIRQARPGSEFDAHVGTLGTIRYVRSTDAEIAAFKRCMETKGFPVARK
jgi:hypothetical protein